MVDYCLPPTVRSFLHYFSGSLLQQVTRPINHATNQSSAIFLVITVSATVISNRTLISCLFIGLPRTRTELLFLVLLVFVTVHGKSLLLCMHAPSRKFKRVFILSCERFNSVAFRLMLRTVRGGTSGVNSFTHGKKTCSPVSIISW